MACASPLGVELGESRKIVTALFTDIVGSTQIAQGMDPESFHRLIDRYFERMRTVVERYSGTIEKFVGDAVSCVFGIPTLREDDALRAVRCALELQEELTRLNTELDATFGVKLGTRSAIHTGEVLATGDISGHVPLLGTVMNVAARLQNAAEAGQILVSDETYRYVRQAVIADALPPLRLKGLADPVAAYRLVKLRPTPHPVSVAARPFVGRERELQEATAVLERVVSNASPEVLLITGSPGIGKSRLVAELARKSRTGSWVVIGRCALLGERMTYAPIAEVVSQLTGFASATPHKAPIARLETALRGIEDRDAVAGRLAALLGADERLGSAEELGWAVRRLFESKARDRLLLVIIEDLHWAEEAVLELVANVARLSRDSKMLLVASARPEFGTMAPAWPEGAVVTRMRLEPLSEEHSRELVENVAEGLAESVLEEVVRSGGGNPLFLEQILASIEEADSVVEKEIHVPASIQALLSSRVDSLSPPERRVIEAASIAGEEFTYESLGALCWDVDGELKQSLAALVEKEFFVAIDEGESEHGFRFRHALIRNAAYEAIPRERRATLHEQFAQWLEKNPPDPLRVDELVGHQLQQAYENKRALGVSNTELTDLASRAAEKLTAAGLKGRSRGDWLSVKSVMALAYALFKDVGVPPIEVVRALSDCYVRLGDIDALEAVGDDCGRLAELTQDRRFEFEEAWTRIYIRSENDPSYSIAETKRDAEELLALAEEVDWVTGKILAWAYISDACETVGDCEGSLDAARRELELAIDANDVSEEAWARGQIVHEIRDGRTPVIEALSTAQDYLDWCRLVGERHRESEAHMHLAVLQAQQGNAEAALDHLERARAILIDLGRTREYPKFGFASFDVNACLGRPQTAEEDVEAAYRRLRDSGATGMASSMGARLGEILCRQGRYAQAEELLQESHAMTAHDDSDFHIFYSKVLAKLYALTGRHDEAIELGRRAIRLADSTDWVNLQSEARLDMAEILRVIGRPDDIPRLAKEAADIAKRKGNVVLERRAEALTAAPR